VGGGGDFHLGSWGPLTGMLAVLLGRACTWAATNFRSLRFREQCCGRSAAYFFCVGRERRLRRKRKRMGVVAEGGRRREKEGSLEMRGSGRRKGLGGRTNLFPHLCDINNQADRSKRGHRPTAAFFAHAGEPLRPGLGGKSRFSKGLRRCSQNQRHSGQ